MASQQGMREHGEQHRPSPVPSLAPASSSSFMKSLPSSNMGRAGLGDHSTQVAGPWGSRVDHASHRPPNLHLHSHYHAAPYSVPISRLSTPGRARWTPIHCPRPRCLKSPCAIPIDSSRRSSETHLLCRPPDVLTPIFAPANNLPYPHISFNSTHHDVDPTH